MSGQAEKIRKRPVGRPKSSPARPYPIRGNKGTEIDEEEGILLSDPGSPPMASFLPTLFCSRRCIYCTVKRSPLPEEDLITARCLEEVFAELREMGVKAVRFSGGDPFARKDIFDVIEALCDEGMIPLLPVKLGLTYYETLRLKNLGVRLVEVGLDATDPIIADRMAGLKGSYARAVRTLGFLRAVGLSAWVKAVLTSANAPAIGKLIDFLGGFGNVVGVTLAPVRADQALGSADRESIAAQVRERVSLYPHMRICAVDRGVAEESWRERSLCAASGRGLAILPDGRVTACEALYDQPACVIGDLRRQSVKEVWSSPEALTFLGSGACPEPSAHRS